MILNPKGSKRNSPNDGLGEVSADAFQAAPLMMTADELAETLANRHTFISNLAKSGVSPKVAQAMARHSDINLTMNVYSHVKMDEQTAAISVLPSPPKPNATENRKTRKKGA